MGVEVRGHCRNLHKGQLRDCTAHQIYYSDQILEREMGWALACIGTTEMHTGLWYRNLQERDNFEVLVVYDRIILTLTLLTWRIG